MRLQAKQNILGLAAARGHANDNPVDITQEAGATSAGAYIKMGGFKDNAVSRMLFDERGRVLLWQIAPKTREFAKTRVRQGAAPDASLEEMPKRCLKTFQGASEASLSATVQACLRQPCVYSILSTPSAWTEVIWTMKIQDFGQQAMYAPPQHAPPMRPCLTSLGTDTFF